MKKRIFSFVLSFLMLLCSLSLVSCDKPDAQSNNDNEIKEVKNMTREIINFNTDWLYSPFDYKNGASTELDEAVFESVCVPHANTFLTEHKGPGFAEQIESYRFVSWYRRHFRLDDSYNGKRVTVEFEGVATIADVYVNGQYVGTHKGAYTTFSFDITDYLINGDNLIAVRVDSERQPDIPPEGGNVDYCLFGGIVRDVNLIVTDPAYIINTFISTPELSHESGKVNAVVDVVNKHSEDKTVTVTSTVFDADGNSIVEISDTKVVSAGQTAQFNAQSDALTSLHLWSIDDPYLYTVRTTLSCDGYVLDDVSSKLGFRWYSFEEKGFYLNGEKIEILGVNRHEQWAWIGRAVSNKHQRADADLIKETGFNAVRCSHYPQDPSFLERCDEIGLIVFEEAPGWQHIGGDEWKELYLENIEEMILRDRNHPSIVSWGTRVNESNDDDELYTKSNALAKELDPTRPTHGVRRMDTYVDGSFLDCEDIFTANYQYPDVPRYRPYIVTEHSMDWFSGHGFSWASDNDALIFTKSFIDVVDYYYGNELCIGGFAWSMFDYNNEVNYTNTDNVFYSGLYDIFRIAKMPSYFYRSQKDVSEEPIIHIANYRTPSSPTTVTIFSNCDEIELFVDGKSVGKQAPNTYLNLPHPVYEFQNVPTDAELKAVGYVDGKKIHTVIAKPAGEPVKLVLKPQYDTLVADGSDFTSVEVYAVDENGTVVPYADNEISISVSNNGRFIGEEKICLEGGSIAFLVQSVYKKTGTITATVTAEGLGEVSCEITVDEFDEKIVPVCESSGTEKPLILTHTDINDSEKGNAVNQFEYVGKGWDSCSQGGCYFVDNHFSRTTGDTVTVKFNGNRFIWYGTVAPNHGIMTIAVDGGEKTEIDCYNVNRCDSIVLFDSGELENGEHTLTVTVTGEKNEASSDTFINVDRVRIYGEISYEEKLALDEAKNENNNSEEDSVAEENDDAAANKTEDAEDVEEPDVVNINDNEIGELVNQLNYVGNWQSCWQPGCYNEDNYYSNTSGDTVSFKFEGTGIVWYGSSAPSHGIMLVSLDGGEEIKIDCYSADRCDSIVLFDSGKLENGEHTLTVTVTGEKNEASSDAFINVDRVTIYK